MTSSKVATEMEGHFITSTGPYAVVITPKSVGLGPTTTTEERHILVQGDAYDASSTKSLLFDPSLSLSEVKWREDDHAEPREAASGHLHRHHPSAPQTYS